MKPAALKQLIEKFYAGETSESEEKQLRQYFEQENLPESMQDIKTYFQAVDELSSEQLGDAFDGRLMEQLTDDKDVKKTKITTYWISGIAATILLFLTFWFGPDLMAPKEVYGTISDPEIAFAESRKVLDEVSKELKKGMTPAKKTVDKVEDNIKKTSEIKEINKALNKTKNLNKLDDASNLLKSFNKVTIVSGNS